MANTVDKVLKIAETEVGYMEKKSNKDLYSKTANAGTKNYTKYGKEMHDLYPSVMDFPASWCDAFVDWCFQKAYGVSNAKGLLGGNFDDYTPNSANLYKKKNAWGTTPKVGAQIFFTNGTRICHTGLVYKVDSEYVYTIEGNTSGAADVVPNGGMVCRKAYKLTNNKISGYGYPKYDVVKTTSSSTSSVKKEATTSKIDTVKEVQKWANTYYKAGLTVDDDYGAKTKKALIKILQTELNQTYKAGLKVDGIWGSKTRSACPTLKKGVKNDVVGVLQALLICNGYKEAYLDKDYGNATVTAVKAYQKKNRLIADGKAGKSTFTKLCS